MPGSFVTLLPLRAGTGADKGSSVKESSLCVCEMQLVLGWWGSNVVPALQIESLARENS